MLKVPCCTFNYILLIAKADLVLLALYIFWMHVWHYSTNYSLGEKKYVSSVCTPFEETYFPAYTEHKTNCINNILILWASTHHIACSVNMMQRQDGNQERKHFLVHREGWCPVVQKMKSTVMIRAKWNYCCGFFFSSYFNTSFKFYCYYIRFIVSLTYLNWSFCN